MNSRTRVVCRHAPDTQTVEQLWGQEISSEPDLYILGYAASSACVFFESRGNTLIMAALILTAKNLDEAVHWRRTCMCRW